MKSSVVWSGVEAGSAALLSVVSSFVVARIIGPQELGVGAAAVSVNVLLWVAVNGLFADTLVQHAAITDRMVWSALWASVAAGCVAMLLQAAAGAGLAWLLHESRLIPMALVLALPLPLVGAGGVMQGLRTRARGYRVLALRTILGQGAGTAVGVTLAVAGAGGWAPVAQQAVACGAGALVLLAAGGHRPRLIWHWRDAAVLLATGLPLTASTLVQLGRYRLFAVLIGGTAGTAALGQVHMAFRLVDTVRELMFTALWRLMLPVLSERQHDPSALLAAVDRLLRRSSRVTMPVCAAMVVAAPALVARVLGPSWTAAEAAVEPLIALTALLALMFPSGVALVAAGGARFTLYGNLAGLAATVAGVLLLRPADPWQAVLVWCGSQVFISPYALWMNGRGLRVSALRPLRAGAAMLGLSAAALLAVLAAWHLAAASAGRHARLDQAPAAMAHWTPTPHSQLRGPDAHLQL